MTDEYFKISGTPVLGCTCTSIVRLNHFCDLSDNRLSKDLTAWPIRRFIGLSFTSSVRDTGVGGTL